MEARAFRCWVPGIIDGDPTGEIGVYLGATASKARYRCFLAANDAGFDVTFADILVRRAPEFDQMEPRHSGWSAKFIPVLSGENDVR